MRSKIFTISIFLSFALSCGGEEDDGKISGWTYQAGKQDSNYLGVGTLDNGPFLKQVALTFDDGPSSSYTEDILDILYDHGIFATFFVKGANVGDRDGNVYEAKNSILQRMRNEGHIIGNHTYSHPNVLSISQAALENEIINTQDLITSIGETRRYFRFPFGNANSQDMQLVAENHNYKVVGWDVDSLDWCFGNDNICNRPEVSRDENGNKVTFVPHVISKIHSSNGGIVLFHDIQQITHNHLEEIVKNLENNGFTFTTLENKDIFPLLNGITPPFIGDICKDDSECDFSNAGVSGICYNFSSDDTEKIYGFCTLPCNGTCPDLTGKASTFCVSLDNGMSGQCVSKASPLNNDCVDILGTVAIEMPRFIGNSNKQAAKAMVCVP